MWQIIKSQFNRLKTNIFNFFSRHIYAFIVLGIALGIALLTALLIAGLIFFVPAVAAFFTSMAGVITAVSIFGWQPLAFLGTGLLAAITIGSSVSFLASALFGTIIYPAYYGVKSAEDRINPDADAFKKTIEIEEIRKAMRFAINPENAQAITAKLNPLAAAELSLSESIQKTLANYNLEILFQQEERNKLSEKNRELNGSLKELYALLDPQCSQEFQKALIDKEITLDRGVRAEDAAAGEKLSLDRLKWRIAIYPELLRRLQDARTNMQALNNEVNSLTVQVKTLQSKEKLGEELFDFSLFQRPLKQHPSSNSSVNNAENVNASQSHEKDPIGEKDPFADAIELRPLGHGS